MEEKKAFVFDTNFIIQTKKLDEVIINLSDRYSVYVTQVSIEERKAQQCREIRARYDEILRIKEECSDFASVDLLLTYDELEQAYHRGIQNKYEKAFKECIIPFSIDDSLLQSVFERANRKIAPFLSEKNASDKGFKDALIWESMLSFFKENGESEVLLISDDDAFKKNASDLCAEFNKVTGKSLSIHPNSYYRDLLRQESVEEPVPQQQIPNVDYLREEIQSIISDLCYVETNNYWGDEIIEKTFTTDQKIDVDYVRSIFSSLEKEIFDHLFETELPASAVLELDNRIQDTGYMIPMAALENAAKLYDDFLKHYPDYIEQFFSAAANIFNQNYTEQMRENLLDDLNEEDGELPF